MKFVESVLRGYADTKDDSVIGDLTASPLITVVTDSNGFFSLLTNLIILWFIKLLP